MIASTCPCRLRDLRRLRGGRSWSVVVNWFSVSFLVVVGVGVVTEVPKNMVNTVLLLSGKGVTTPYDLR